MAALLPLSCQFCASSQCKWFSKSIFYSCVLFSGGFFGSVHWKFCNRWDYQLDSNYWLWVIHQVMFSFISYNTWSLFWSFLIKIKSFLDCVFAEDKGLRASEASHLCWLFLCDLHMEKDAGGLQLSPLLPLPGTTPQSPHCTPLGTHCARYHTNHVWKANPNTQTILGADTWWILCSLRQREVAGRALCPSCLRWALMLLFLAMQMFQAILTCTISPHS